MLDLARIQALCFDVDGTLSDTDDAWAQSLGRPLQRLLPHRDVRTFARRVIMELEAPGNWAYALLDRLGLDDEIGWLFNRFSRLAHRGGKKNFLLIPNTRETLSALAPRYPMSIVSARGQKGTLAFLEQYNLQPFFQAVATSQTCRYTKPYPHPILWAAQQMGIPPEACLMIGDTSVDIRAGKAAGAQTVGVLCGFGSQPGLLRAGADLILPSPAELVDVLLSNAPAPATTVP